MSRTVDLTIGGPALPRVPNIVRAVVAAETKIVPVLTTAGRQEANAIKGAIHSRTGTLAASVSVSTRRLPNGGVAMRYGAIRKGSFATRKNGSYEAQKQNVFYADFVDRGTGTHGPLGRKIRKRGLVRVGAAVFPPSGEGQVPQRMFTESAERFGQTSLSLDSVIDGILTAEIIRAEIGR